MVEKKPSDESTPYQEELEQLREAKLMEHLRKQQKITATKDTSVLPNSSDLEVILGHPGTPKEKKIQILNESFQNSFTESRFFGSALKQFNAGFPNKILSMSEVQWMMRFIRCVEAASTNADGEATLHLQEMVPNYSLNLMAFYLILRTHSILFFEKFTSSWKAFEDMVQRSKCSRRTLEEMNQIVQENLIKPQIMPFKSLVRKFPSFDWYPIWKSIQNVVPQKELDVQLVAMIIEIASLLKLESLVARLFDRILLSPVSTYSCIGLKYGARILFKSHGPMVLMGTFISAKAKLDRQIVLLPRPSLELLSELASPLLYSKKASLAVLGTCYFWKKTTSSYFNNVQNVLDRLYELNVPIGLYFNTCRDTLMIHHNGPWNFIESSIERLSKTCSTASATELFLIELHRGYLWKQPELIQKMLLPLIKACCYNDDHASLELVIDYAFPTLSEHTTLPPLVNSFWTTSLIKLFFRVYCRKGDTAGLAKAMMRVHQALPLGALDFSCLQYIINPTHRIRDTNIVNTISTVCSERFPDQLKNVGFLTALMDCVSHDDDIFDNRMKLLKDIIAIQPEDTPVEPFVYLLEALIRIPFNEAQQKLSGFWELLDTHCPNVTPEQFNDHFTSYSFYISTFDKGVFLKEAFARRAIDLEQESILVYKALLNLITLDKFDEFKEAYDRAMEMGTLDDMKHICLQIECAERKGFRQLAYMWEGNPPNQIPPVFIQEFVQILINNHDTSFLQFGLWKKYFDRPSAIYHFLHNAQSMLKHQSLAISRILGNSHTNFLKFHPPAPLIRQTAEALIKLHQSTANLFPLLNDARDSYCYYDVLAAYPTEIRHTMPPMHLQLSHYILDPESFAQELIAIIEDQPAPTTIKGPPVHSPPISIQTDVIGIYHSWESQSEESPLFIPSSDAVATSIRSYEDDGVEPEHQSNMNHKDLESELQIPSGMNGL